MEKLCYRCKVIMATMVEDGISRIVCPSCGPAPRPVRRPRFDKRPKAWRGTQKIA